MRTIRSCFILSFLLVQTHSYADCTDYLGTYEYEGNILRLYERSFHLQAPGIVDSQGTLDNSQNSDEARANNHAYCKDGRLIIPLFKWKNGKVEVVEKIELDLYTEKNGEKSIFGEIRKNLVNFQRVTTNTQAVEELPRGIAQTVEHNPAKRMIHDRVDLQNSQAPEQQPAQPYFHRGSFPLPFNPVHFENATISFEGPQLSQPVIRGEPISYQSIVTTLDNFNHLKAPCPQPVIEIPPQSVNKPVFCWFDPFDGKLVNPAEPFACRNPRCRSENPTLGDLGDETNYINHVKSHTTMHCCYCEVKMTRRYLFEKHVTKDCTKRPKQTQGPNPEIKNAFSEFNQ